MIGVLNIIPLHIGHLWIIDLICLCCSFHTGVMVCLAFTHHSICIKLFECESGVARAWPTLSGWQKSERKEQSQTAKANYINQCHNSIKAKAVKSHLGVWLPVEMSVLPFYNNVQIPMSNILMQLWNTLLQVLGMYSFLENGYRLHTGINIVFQFCVIITMGVGVGAIKEDLCISMEWLLHIASWVGSHAGFSGWR